MRLKPGAEPVIRPNKTQLKRDSAELQSIGEQLTLATAATRKKCELPEALQSAVTLFLSLPNKHGARRRQMQFIGKLMRELDETTLSRIHQHLHLNVELEKRRFSKLEQLRDNLLSADAASLTDILRQHPQLEPQLLGQLVRQARKEQLQSDSPPTVRKLFRYLRERIDKGATG